MTANGHTGAPDGTKGGLPPSEFFTSAGLGARRTTLVLGCPGAGKTLFALQTLVSSARRGEVGVLVSFGQSFQALAELASGFGWNLAGLVAEGLLVLETPAEGALPGNLLSDLTKSVKRARARHIAFDSLHLAGAVEPLSAGTQELLGLRDWLFEHDLSATLTSRVEDVPLHSIQRCALLDMLVDCTLTLQFEPGASPASRRLRVSKYRGSEFRDCVFPFVIGPAGIELALPSDSVPLTTPGPSPNTLRAELELARKQLSTGIQALDRFVEIKQAELDFLREESSKAQSPAAIPPGAGQPARATFIDPPGTGSDQPD